MNCYATHIELILNKLKLTNFFYRDSALTNIWVLFSNAKFQPSETRLDEHAAEQRRHRFVQRDVVRCREDIVEDQDGGQYRRRELRTQGGDQEDLEEDQPEAAGSGRSTARR